MVIHLSISSTSPPGGNQVDGLPPASSWMSVILDFGHFLSKFEIFQNSIFLLYFVIREVFRCVWRIKLYRFDVLGGGGTANFENFDFL